MSGTNSIRLAVTFDGAIPRQTHGFCPPPAHNRAFRKIPILLDGSRHSRQSSGIAKLHSWFSHAPTGEFPFTDPANAGMRRKFDLPLDRPLNP
jgi:hypothetical protein